MSAAAIAILQQARALIRAFAGTIPAEMRYPVPEGFRNHIAWNLGHMVVTQQQLAYRVSGLPMYVDDAMVGMFRKGTSPLEWTSAPPEWDTVLAMLTALPDRLADDYAAGRFKDFQRYETSVGVTLNTIDDAIAFTNFHDGTHMGIIMGQLHVLKT